MWTPKKRQRVSRACDQCKRTKKQCSGTQPCATCHSKSSTCTFSAPSQPQHLSSRASIPINEHSDNNASDSTDGIFHRKAPSNNRSVSGGLDSVWAPALPPPKDFASGDVTPIQNRGRLLQDHEGRLGEKAYSG